MTRTPLVPADARIGRAALRVGDLDELVDFYRAIVGLTVQSRTDTTATLGVDGTALLVLRLDEDVPPRGPTRAGLFHTAFRVPSRAALGAALERIERDGNGAGAWELSGASDHDVSEALYLSDPEGNGVEIYADRPRDAWPRADDGSITMRTLPLDLDALRADSDGTGAAPSGTTIGHVHLETTDLDAARSFYADTLGLRVQLATRGAVFCSMGDYHHHVGLNAWNGRSDPAGGRGLDWFEFTVSDRATVSDARDGLSDAGVSVTETDDGIAFADPDGIGLRLRTA
ncbi:VOC family protein [Halovivax cerinus]|uniref:VOC family protein n=1 Tax=Halovivax cerinus TaxID=1487865 RepID=A0ABD5NTD3_9EURY|nr:VOC family protein [Halovivax cerinus]